MSDLTAEMGIYWNNLLVIVMGNNLLPIIATAQNRFYLLITDIVSVRILLSPINYCDKQFFLHTVFKVSKFALRKKYKVSIQSCHNLKNSLVLFNVMAESVNSPLL